jgi:hypothetical protein
MRSGRSVGTSQPANPELTIGLPRVMAGLTAWHTLNRADCRLDAIRDIPHDLNDLQNSISACHARCVPWQRPDCRPDFRLGIGPAGKFPIELV